MAGLDDLFSRLKAQQDTSSREDNPAPAPVPVNIWQQASSSKPNDPASDPKTSNSLLDLLNIRAQTAQTPQRATSSFNLPSAEADPHRALPVRLSSTTSVPPVGEPSTSTQKFLLDLLNKPKTSVKPTDSTVATTSTTQPELQHHSSAVTEPTAGAVRQGVLSGKQEKHNGAVDSKDVETQSQPPLSHTAADSRQSDAHKPPQTPNRSGVFKYVNPFDQLRVSSPLNLPPKPEEDADNGKSLSVAEKLQDVGYEVGNQAEQALAHAESAGNGVKDDVDSNWSTAEDDDARAEQEDQVEVYNFPLKPFVALALDRNYVPRSFRLATSDKATPVARLKKDFSHDDRSLVTASQAHIIYSVPPTDKKPASGFKLIRQDDGKNKHLWSHKKERICSVQIAATAQNSREAVIATGVNGSMYFITLPTDDIDDFAALQPETDGIVLSPPPNSDEPAQPTDTPSIRTRAKLSNLKPSTYFAIARGRHIHLIAPELAKSLSSQPDAGDANTELYLSKYSFSINIAKACKDFCFSEDDTVVASLDKLGKVKFWDIQPLTKAIDNGSPAKILIKDPLHSIALSAATSKADSKSSPTSIMFLDKDRTHAKRVALRYMLVGFQQNHVLQLWDLGLGKCVQELRLPDAVGQADSTSEESKGMCSLAYHSKSSIIVIGHPGRNSIFLIHLSAPKYNLNPLSQSSYLAALANQDLKTAPKPENTAILSGLREFSCNKVGQLRSLDILRTPFPSSPPDTQEEVLFEIYLMHSQGVLGLPITRDDLGWDAKGKLVKPADAVDRGIVTVSELSSPPVVASETSRTSSATSVVQSKAGTSKSADPAVEPKTAVRRLPNSQPASYSAAAASLSSSSPKTKPVPTPDHTAEPSEATPTASSKIASERPRSSARELLQSNSPSDQSENVSGLAQVNGSAKTAVNGDLHLSEQFSQLYKKLDNDRRIAEAAGAAKQDAILRLVSSTLTDNVESSLQRIVIDNIRDQVLPAVVSGLQENVTSSLRSSVPDLVRKELTAILPGAINDALSNSKVTQSLAVAVAKQMESVVAEVIKTQLRDVTTRLDSSSSKHSNSTTSALSKLSSVHTESSQAVLRRLEESEARVTALLGSVQQEQLYLRESIARIQNTKDDTDLPKQVENPESPEVQHLTQLLNDGKFEQATVEWLQSTQQAELFDQLFVRINPEYLKHVSSLVALSVSAAVTASLESNLDKRLEWLGSVISNVDVEDQEIQDVAPKIMDVLIQRLLGTYMQVSETQPNNQEALRKVAALSRLISNTRKAFD